MGATPRFTLVSLAISRRTSQAWVKGFYSGLLALARRADVAVVGGDIAVVPGNTVVDVVVVGEAWAGRIVPRSGARSGDGLFVSGWLGLSALGLHLLKTRSIRDRLGKQAVQAHLYPEPRLELGRYLGGRRLASSLMDISDGLSTDLSRLCEASGVGAEVWAANLPTLDSGGDGPSPPGRVLDLALHGGEDYELLFTVPARKMSSFPSGYRGVGLHWIGRITGSKAIVLVFPDGTRSLLKPGGYDHFRKA
jgi:thiamine-monophosphate kinase